LWWCSESRRLYTRRADESWGIARWREASTSVVVERDVGSSETEVAKGGKDGSDGGLQRVPVGVCVCVCGESARRANAARVSLAGVSSVVSSNFGRGGRRCGVVESQARLFLNKVSEVGGRVPCASPHWLSRRLSDTADRVTLTHNCKIFSGCLSEQFQFCILIRCLVYIAHSSIAAHWSTSSVIEPVLKR
jgi:hypothetical protein